MKKLLCLLLALLMIASVALVACDDTSDDTVDYNDTDDLTFTPSQPSGNQSDAPTTDAPTEAPTTSAPAASLTFTDVNETVYVQNCVQVKVRSTPDASNEKNVVGTADFGKSYKRVKVNDLWSAIEVDGEVLYLNTYFLTDKPDEVVFSMKEETPKVLYVTNIDPNNGDLGNLYLRTFTSTSPDTEFHPTGNVGAVAKHGAKLDVTGISADGHWYRVDFTSEGKTIKNLYVWNGKYVTTTNPVVETDTTAQ